MCTNLWSRREGYQRGSCYRGRWSSIKRTYSFRNVRRYGYGLVLVCTQLLQRICIVRKTVTRRGSSGKGASVAHSLEIRINPGRFRFRADPEGLQATGTNRVYVNRSENGRGPGSSRVQSTNNQLLDQIIINFI